MLKDTTLTRCGSFTTTELSSQTSDLEQESALMETSLKAHTLKAHASITERCSSSHLLELSQAELEVLQKEHRSSILVVKTQKESLTTSSLAASQRPEGAVSFGQLHIREYARRPGDNPGCRIGVSLTIDWQVQDEMSIDLEAYEESRPPRRDRGELNIPSETRMQLLKDSGYSRGEILTYVKLANIARQQRNRTNETLQLQGAQEMAQRLVRGVLNKSVFRSKKNKEKKLIEKSRAKDQQLLLLRRQITPAEVEPKLSAPEVVEQAPPVAKATTTRRAKRDSLAIMAPVAVPVPQEALSDSETSTEDLDAAPLTAITEEVDC